MSGVPEDWYDGFFEGAWLDYASRDVRPGWTEQTVEFLVEQLELREGARVLDLACGRGRVAIPLAERGVCVTGLDLSARSLELARLQAEDAGIELELIRRDMRELDAVETYDVVLNLFSSFGYFHEQADDELVVAAVARALVPGGAFFLDTINPVALAAAFVARDWREFDDGTVLVEERSYDHLRGRDEATWTFVGPDGGRSELRHSLRAYTAPELVAMLDRAGLEVDGAWGSWEGAELGEGHRTLLRARKRG
ncbi:MAG TPA: class I SAM-dependent methyltransferase [Gaiellaceae bacterium]|nr:class I SAM-dependent methyltransferase [Gaiellaceae bacterium]